MNKRRILINAGAFVIFYSMLLLYIFLVIPTIGRNLEVDYYSNRIGTFCYTFFPPLILSAIIIGRLVIVRKISADKNRTVLIADIVELILSILVLAVTVLYGYGMNGFVYMVFYSVSCIGTLVSDLI